MVVSPFIAVSCREPTPTIRRGDLSHDLTHLHTFGVRRGIRWRSLAHRRTSVFIR